MGKIIGIDLGTTNSVVAVMENGTPKVIPNQEGDRTTPSVVGYTRDGEFIVGRAARNQAVTNPKNTVYSAKRFIGLHFTERKDEASKMPYTVKQSSGDKVLFELGGKEMAPPEISAKVLGKLKASAEAYLGQTVTQAVITVPAYFNDSQRQATKDAGRIAGLEVLRIINEPTASALAYGIQTQANHQTIVVYDMGGGTFDVSILELSDDVYEVKSTNGDTHLGGDDFDERIVHYLLDIFKKETNIDLTSDRTALQRLREAAEKAKMELSSILKTEINLPFISADASGPKHLTVELSRAKLEAITADLVDRSLTPVRQALLDAGIRASEINAVVLVGGQTRMPAIQDAVRNFFNKEPHKGINPDEVVAIGAAIQAGVLAGDVANILLLDVTPLTLGIETSGGVMTPLISRNTTLPTYKSQVFSTAADNQDAVEIHVLQGERAEARHNKSLGTFVLDGIPPAPRGVPQIEVTFDIDADGLIHASARDKATEREQHITITASSGLSQAEVDAMVREAELHADDDRRKRDVLVLQNQIDSLMYNAQRALRNDETISPERRGAAEAVLKVAQGAIDRGDETAIRDAIVEMTIVVHDLQNKYRPAPTSMPAPGETGQLPVIDERTAAPEPAKKLSLRDLLRRGRDSD